MTTQDDIETIRQAVKYIRHEYTEGALEALDRLAQGGKFKIGDRVKKKGTKGQWRGHVVGTYSASITPIGYNVESELEIGSVQIYPEDALELQTPKGADDAN